MHIVWKHIVERKLEEEKKGNAIRSVVRGIGVENGIRAKGILQMQLQGNDFSKYASKKES